MKITEKFLRDLTGAPVVLINRFELPFEIRFAEAVNPRFSRKELEARRIAFGRFGVKIHKANKYRLRSPWCWVSIKGEERKWSLETRLLGMRIFGDSFQNYTEGNGKIIAASIIPDSPFLDLKSYWRYHTGLDVTSIAEKTLDEIFALHEAGHVAFPYSAKQLEKKKTHYLSEALADGFAIRTYLDNGGENKHVRDFIHARRMLAFLGSSASSHWTAAACEATLRREQMPLHAEVFDTMRELQIRVIDDLRGLNGNDLDSTAYHKKYKYTGSFWDFEHSVSDLFKNGNVWKTDNVRLAWAFSKYSKPEIMASLQNVVENAKISNAARMEGQKILDAYAYFCPDRPISAYRVRRASLGDRLYSRVSSRIQAALRPRGGTPKQSTSHNFAAVR